MKQISGQVFRNLVSFETSKWLSLVQNRCFLRPNQRQSSYKRFVSQSAYEPAKMEQYQEFLQLTQDQAADYLGRTLELMEITWEQFSQLFKTVGQVYGIYAEARSPWV